MKQHSFSLADAAEQGKKHRQFWSSQMQPSSSDEPNPRNVTDWKSNEETTKPNPTNQDEGTSVNTLSSPSRIAHPINKPTAPQRPGPSLRPKGIPKLVPAPTEPCEENRTTPPSDAAPKPKPTSKPIEPKAAPFGDRYERITTYLEKPLFRRVHDLHERGEIAKIASLLNAAVREYLDRYYPIP